MSEHTALVLRLTQGQVDMLNEMVSAKKWLRVAEFTPQMWRAFEDLDMDLQEYEYERRVDYMNEVGA